MAKLGSKIVKPRPKHGFGSAEDPNAETQTAIDLLEVSPLLCHSLESDRDAQGSTSTRGEA